MDPRPLARAAAIGRILIGAGLIAQPELLTVPWVGRAAAAPGARVLSRSLGVRDLVLGAGAISCAEQELPAWLIAAMAADATDLLATATGGDSLPMTGRILVGGTAFAATALGVATLVALGRRP